MKLTIECERCGVISDFEPAPGAAGPVYWHADTPCPDCGGRVFALLPSSDATEAEVQKMRARVLEAHPGYHKAEV